MNTEEVIMEEQAEGIKEAVPETTPKKTRKQTSRKKQTATTVEKVVSEEPVKKTIVPKEVDLGQYITVRNGFHGKLVYKSSRTGEKFVWDSFGAEQEMELRELRNAKNSVKGYFKNNWFIFDEPWVVEYLGLKNFYKNSLGIESFDEIFKKDSDEIKQILTEMSDGQKKSVAYRASELIANGEIDSLKTITALEESLGIELIEH